VSCFAVNFIGTILLSSTCYMISREDTNRDNSYRPNCRDFFNVALRPTLGAAFIVLSPCIIAGDLKLSSIGKFSPILPSGYVETYIAMASILFAQIPIAALAYAFL
jgi:hypothetical protein